MPIISEENQPDVLKALAQMTWTMYSALISIRSPYQASILNVMKTPKVGDMVLELSTYHQARENDEIPVVGKVIEVQDSGRTTIIDRLTGARERWANSEFIVILEKPIYDYEHRD